MKRNKKRSDDNALGQVSLPKEMLENSKEYARSMGLPWATWVRTLIMKEMGGANAVKVAEVPRPQLLPARAGAGAVKSGERKCRVGDAAHCPVKSKKAS